MKSGRFILNSDFCTTRVTGSKELVGTIPNSYTTPSGSPNFKMVLNTTTVGDAADNYSIYFTSSSYSYATPGPICTPKPSGSTGLNGITVAVSKKGNSYTLYIVFGNQSSPETYTGFGMAITAHIKTYKNPFSA